LQAARDSHDNRRMDDSSHLDPAPDLPDARTVRRFWTAWLVVMLVMLAVFIVILLIASVEADPPRVSPGG
jgi:hypothetical protein